MDKGIRITHDDPIFILLALNEAVLEQVQRNLSKTINSLPSIADKEMQRAGAETISTLSVEVGKIAKQLAGDAATAEKNRSFYFAGAVIFICAIIFGGTGYTVRMAADTLSNNTLKDEVAEANMQADAAVAAAKKKASDDINVAQKNAGWAGTAEGRLAKQFFDSGAGHIAATCDSPVWEIRDLQDGKYCVPNRRPIFRGDENDYGWKIP